MENGANKEIATTSKATKEGIQREKKIPPLKKKKKRERKNSNNRNQVWQY